MKATPGERRFAEDVARWMERAREQLDRAGKAADDSAEQRRAFANFYAACEWIGRYLAASASPKTLRQLANVLDGEKLPGAPHDDLLLRAYEKAACEGKRKAEREGVLLPVCPDGLPFFSEVDEAYRALAKLHGEPTLTEEQVRRRLKVLGLGLSKDRP
jgi:hypothetical protein